MTSDLFSTVFQPESKVPSTRAAEVAGLSSTQAKLQVYSHPSGFHCQALGRRVQRDFGRVKPAFFVGVLDWSCAKRAPLKAYSNRARPSSRFPGLKLKDCGYGTRVLGRLVCALRLPGFWQLGECELRKIPRMIPGGSGGDASPRRFKRHLC